MVQDLVQRCTVPMANCSHNSDWQSPLTVHRSPNALVPGVAPAMSVETTPPDAMSVDVALLSPPPPPEPPEPPLPPVPVACAMSPWLAGCGSGTKLPRQPALARARANVSASVFMRPANATRVPSQNPDQPLGITAGLRSNTEGANAAGWGARPQPRWM